MSQRITRRQLLGGGIKAGIGLALWKELNLNTVPAFAMAPAKDAVDDARFQPAFARLDEFIAAHMRDVGAPGMTLALANRDGLLRASAYGFADMKAGVKVRPDTLFEIGSISKSFVALALMQMRDEGKFDPAKPITNYLPWLRIESKFPPVTGHHLLSHTSGLPGGVSFELIGSDQSLWTGFAPGEHFVYSNIGYDLLGLVLEAIDRQPIATVLRRRVLDPLGMVSSEPVITNAIRPRVAIGYAPMFDDRPFPLRGELAEASWMEFSEGAGSVSSTATDMGEYLGMLINRGRFARGSSPTRGPQTGSPAGEGAVREGSRGGRIVSEKSFESITSPVIKAPFRGEDASYAYGLWVSEIEGRTLLRHTGGMVAFSSAMHVDITSGFGVFASVNANLAGYRPVVVAKYALDLLRAIDGGKDLPSVPSTSTLPDQISNAAEYAGTFTSADGTRLALAAEGARLWFTVGAQRVALERVGGDRFVVKHPEFDLFPLEFGRDRNLVVEAFHGPRWFRNERYTGAKTFVYPQEWEAFAGHYRSDSPWFGSTRIFARKGKLTADGSPLTPLGDGLFRVGAEEWSPERLGFGPAVNGRATRMKVSGVEFHRTFIP